MIRLLYVRYADEFLFGIIGPKSIAKQVQTRISQFLKDELQLNVEQTTIVHATSGSVDFLATKIRGVPKKDCNSQQAEVLKRARHRRRTHNSIGELTWKSYCSRTTLRIWIEAFERTRKSLGSAATFAHAMKRVPPLPNPNNELAALGPIFDRPGVLDCSQTRGGPILLAPLKFSDGLRPRSKPSLNQLAEDKQCSEMVRSTFVKEICEIHDRRKTTSKWQRRFTTNTLSIDPRGCSDLSEVFGFTEHGVCKHWCKHPLRVCISLRSNQCPGLCPFRGTSRGNEVCKPRPHGFRGPGAPGRSKIGHRSCAPVCKKQGCFCVNKNTPREVRSRFFLKSDPRILAPLNRIRELLRFWGIVDRRQCRPQRMSSLLTQEDTTIINYFCSISSCLLNYYRCCDNLHKVKHLVNYQVRWSALLTLANKYHLSIHQAIRRFGMNLVVRQEIDGKNHVMRQFPSKRELATMGKQFLLRTKDVQRDFVDDTIHQLYNLSKQSRSITGKCCVKGCDCINPKGKHLVPQAGPISDRPPIEMYHVRRLMHGRTQRCWLTIQSSKGKRIVGWRAIHEAWNRKHIPLCQKHYRALHHGDISREDLEPSPVTFFGLKN